MICDSRVGRVARHVAKELSLIGWFIPLCIYQLNSLAEHVKLKARYYHASRAGKRGLRAHI